MSKQDERTVKNYLKYLNSIEAETVGHAVDIDMEREFAENLLAKLQAAQPTESVPDWVIQLRGDYLLTRGIWERPDHRGYTNDINEAGRYTEAEARKTEQMTPEKYKAVRLPDDGVPESVIHAIAGLTKAYIANPGTKSEYISCITPQKGRHDPENEPDGVWAWWQTLKKWSDNAPQLP